VTVVLASGCGNLFNPNQTVVSSATSSANNFSTSSAISDNFNTSGSAAPSNYHCPSTPNIASSTGSILTMGYNSYFACTTKNATTGTISSSIFIEPGPTQGNNNSSVCVFPMEASSSGQIQFVPGTSAGNPTYICQSIPSTGEFFQFTPQPTSATFNSLIIVDASLKDQMVQCLIGSTNTACPDYFYGTLN
jgi:hypothetical protein